MDPLKATQAVVDYGVVGVLVVACLLLLATVVYLYRKREADQTSHMDEMLDLVNHGHEREIDTLRTLEKLAELTKRCRVCKFAAEGG